MNKYKIAESIVTQLLQDLQTRMNSGTKWDVSDENIQAEVTDKWEDIIIAEIEKSEK